METTLNTVPCHVAFGVDAIGQIAAGVALLTRVARLAYGPRGGKVMVERPLDSPLLVADAHTICKDFEIEARLPNVGVKLVQEALARSRRIAGDGGTTTVILLDVLLRRGVRAIAGGAEPRSFVRGMEAAVAAALDSLSSRKTAIEGSQQLARYLRALSPDPDIVALLQQTVAEVGPAGMILVEESKRIDSQLVIERGIQLERGLVSSLLATDTQKLESALSDVHLLLYAGELSAHDQVVGVLEHVRSRRGSLLVVADGIQGTALSTLVTNKIKGVVDVAAILSPGFGTARQEALEDLALMTGGAVVTDVPRAADLATCLGHARRALVGKTATRIEQAGGSPTAIAARRGMLEAQRQGWLSEQERDHLDRRIANLVGRTAILRIGGTTDPAMGDRLQEAERAVRGLQAALRGGVLPGGGLAFAEAARAAGHHLTLEGDARRGADALLYALACPLRQLLHNAGIDRGESLAIVARYAAGSRDWGYDIERGWVALDEYLLDSASMLATALSVSSSLASLLLTSSVAVTNLFR